jgi:hypothetical protein
MDKMFVVEIDPRKKSIERVEFNEESIRLKDMYSSLECDMVERVALNENIDLWIDEEGVLNNASERIGYFNLGEYQFVGKGLICGLDEEGESVPLSSEDAEFILDNLIVQF